MDGVEAYERKRSRATAGYLGFGADTRELQRFIDVVSHDAKGRRVVRNAATASLQLFNVAAGKNAKELPLKKSGKGWRKKIAAKGSYKYEAKCQPSGFFHAVTGINYRKHPILSVSHLVEAGFNHPHTGWVEGNWYRWEAFKKNRQRVMHDAVEGMRWGWLQVAKTGKVPSIAKIRNRPK